MANISVAIIFHVWGLIRQLVRWPRSNAKIGNKTKEHNGLGFVEKKAYLNIQMRINAFGSKTDDAPLDPKDGAAIAPHKLAPTFYPPPE